MNAFVGYVSFSECLGKFCNSMVPHVEEIRTYYLCWVHCNLQATQPPKLTKMLGRLTTVMNIE